jgi:hypothetical protein
VGRHQQQLRNSPRDGTQLRHYPCVHIIHTEFEPFEDAMERELTPVEARGGLISGRIVTVLAISFVGAVIALAGVWATIGMPK